ncbi:5-methylthioadenosine/S-adenosylhomocysteine deaminase [Saccharopolyspora antimicrobica]|uniref:5-methylthioadenosine/S-adenosylhomocysteine deaminase n=1 Tax=Saccharopolyspora antimicrobica TaxID=455193 RepID=A0A1I4S151_9PSEU|nr:amidohydrolase [Saccharopolyspora antimicrobica]RKT87540.1 5-methylthioadenosine/S-adenosylhomocysteine deaminase [Saccharopolyspora antimicrobica]SFM58217.1 5-methylthioadenosine/S-adenosylhomocysteine deaminase [Saccharopolyspora antimicrobica]
MPAVHEKLCDLLLTDATVLTVDDHRTIHRPGTVAVTGNRISAVGPQAEMADWQGETVLDCTGKAVLPGLVDGHNHLYQALARGLGEGLSIVPWLCDFMWPYSIAVQGADAVAAARLAAAEALRHGTTTVVDNHYAPTDLETTLAVADVVERTGLRGAIARGIVGPRTEIAAQRGQPEELFRYSTADELAITREAVQHRPPGSRVEVWPAPLNLTYVDQDLVRRSIELARELGTSWHAHCCEGRSDPQSYLDAYRSRPVQWLAEAGLLDQRATLAHAIWLDETEVEQVAEADARVVHNPTSNAYLASGTLALAELRERGVAVGLGTDGPSCGHRQDLFECMKQSVLAQRSVTLDPTAMRAQDALDLATRDGARCAGIDAGVLEAGRLADLIVVDLDRPHLQPLHDVVSTLVYAARGSDVVVTVVDGEIVQRDGRCLRVDEASAVAEARERAELLLHRAGMTHLLR